MRYARDRVQGDVDFVIKVVGLIAWAVGILLVLGFLVMVANNQTQRGIEECVKNGKSFEYCNEYAR